MLTTPRWPKLQGGFSLPELIVASAAFVVILTSAVTILVQWQQIAGASEGDITAIEQNTRALGMIAEDVRTASYLYHLATVSIQDDTGRISPAHYQWTIPVVTQANRSDLLDHFSHYDPAEATDSNYLSHGTDLIGDQSTGTLPVLAMISDQPYGMDRPRYIVYWLGSAMGPPLKSRSDRLKAARDGEPNNATMSVRPLYRLEATPSIPQQADSWYPYDEPLLTGSATSSLHLILGNTVANSFLTTCSPAGDDANIGYKLTKVADILVETDPAETQYPFSLHNFHPYSNDSLISPNLAEIQLRVSRKGVGALRSGTRDIIALKTTAFARNVPLAQRNYNSSGVHE